MHINFKTHASFPEHKQIFVPRHTKSGRVLYIPKILSVHPSAFRFWTLTRVVFDRFLDLCMDIHVGEEWFGIANGLNLFMNNRVMALD